jgi:hypothetical protein
MSLTVDRIEGACPTQAYGEYHNPRGKQRKVRFYFRARHGSWNLRVGETEKDAIGAESLMEGADGTGGWMSPRIVIELLWVGYIKWLAIDDED